MKDRGGPDRPGRLPATGASCILPATVRLLTRVSVLLLAVALVPLLRFIDMDAYERPSAAPYPIDGVSDHDSNGVVVDRKQSTRYVSRMRGSAGGDTDDDELGVIPEPAPDSSSADDAATRLGTGRTVARTSEAHSSPRARGPPA